MNKSWTCLISIGCLAVLMFIAGPAFAADAPADNAATKPAMAAPDNQAKLAQVTQGIETAKKLAAAGDAKGAAAELEIVSKLMADLQESMKTGEDQMVKRHNMTCPIMKMSLTVVPVKNTRQYKGKTIGFCCSDCPLAWDKLSDAEKEKKFAEMEAEGNKVIKVDNIKCPIMDMALTAVPQKNTRQYKGKLIGFCCSDCTTTWDKLSDEEKDKKFQEVMPK